MRARFAFLFLTSIAMFGCTDGPVDSGDNSLLLSLKVVDSTDKPISDVGFQYIFYTGEEGNSKNILIGYSLPSPDTVTVSFYDPFGRLISTPVDHQFRQSGNYIAFFDGPSFTNGIYGYKITRPSSTKEGQFTVRTDDVAALDSLQPLTKTNQGGALTIQYSTLGIGSRFKHAVGSDSIDVIVSDSITILLQKSGFRDYLEGLRLNRSKNTERTIQLVGLN